ncbi:MAG: hypothetical protein ACKVX7_01055 [Planctomycetota bacterium]
MSLRTFDTRPRTLLRSLLLFVTVLAGSSVPVAAQPPPRNDVSAIEDSIERGRTFLYSALRRAGEASQDHYRSSYPMGYHALAVYALLEAGTPHDAPLVREMFRQLDRLPMTQVYSVALYVLALDAWWRATPRPAAPAPSRGKTQVPTRAKIEGRTRVRLAAAIEWLVNGVVPNKGVWGYESVRDPASRGWADFSNTQFAVLALHVGRQHEIAVPRLLFEQIATTHLESGWETTVPERLRCEGPGWWSELPPAQLGQADQVVLDASGYTVIAAPMVWPYVPDAAGLRRSSQYSMIAAATSSLVVARFALEAATEAQSPESTERTRAFITRIDGGICGGMVGLADGFSHLYPAASDTLHRNYYYTIYSVEKAFDLGGVERIQGRDWHAEQSRLLVTEQGPNGAWGVVESSGEQQVVSTCFALLFLKRATRRLRVQALGPIVTGLGDAGGVGIGAGRLFIPSREGTVDAAEFFKRLASERTSELLELAREAVAACAPHDGPELLPHLVACRGTTKDAVDRWSRKAILEISGLAGESAALQVEAWLSSLRRVRKLGQADATEPIDELLELLRRTGETARLQLEILAALVRRNDLGAVPALIEKASDSTGEIHKATIDALEVLTGESVVRSGPVDERDDRAATVSRWRELWAREGATLQTKRSWDKLRAALDRATQPAERARLRAQIVGLGSSILPHVDAILAQAEFAFDWVLIRAELRGEPVGL